MEILTIEELRRQCNVDFRQDDEILKLYGEAAEIHVINHVRRSVDELRMKNYRDRTGDVVESVDELPAGDWFPAPIKVAMLMIAADLYTHRESQVNIAQNPLYSRILKPFRKF